MQECSARILVIMKPLESTDSATDGTNINASILIHNNYAYLESHTSGFFHSGSGDDDLTSFQLESGKS